MALAAKAPIEAISTATVVSDFMRPSRQRWSATAGTKPPGRL